MSDRMSRYQILEDERQEEPVAVTSVKPVQSSGITKRIYLTLSLP